MKNETGPSGEPSADGRPAEAKDAGRRAAVRKLAYATPAIAAVMLVGGRAHAQGSGPPGLPSNPFGDD